ncbi:hypothetical protein CRU98_10030 [Arcobacter sp. CECT 8986]|uniref:hypothetical protein n=1 Tax=Arcobacter sp. CECT 8986 TaxID=2044507 RepID=UPI001009E39D|nr:hypothetical protein [Arcobacter sp. CECT 8986]RXJ98367.1 hypothetical protein CRU98_10030 [Arcobacter sp. CECT 8986]
MKYQVTYIEDTKTFYSNVEAKHYNDVLNFFENCIGATVSEIREYVYQTKQDNFNLSDNYRNSIVVNASNKFGYLNIKLPKVKKSLDEKKLAQMIKQHIKIKDTQITYLTLKI